MKRRLQLLVVVVVASAACGAPTPAEAPPRETTSAAAMPEPAPSPVEPVTPRESQGAPPSERPPAPAGTPPEEQEEDPSRGQVAPGDSLHRILARAGLDRQGIVEAEQALARITDPGALAPGQHFELTLAEDGRLQSLALERSATERATLHRNAKGALEGTLDRETVDTEVAAVAVRIDSSLWEAITGAAEHPALVNLLVEAFAWDLDFFTDTRPGDTVRLLVEKRTVAGAFIGYGDLLAAEYAGQVGTVRVFHWDPPGRAPARLVDEQGRGVERTLLKTPLKFSRVSSEFDPKRMHPVLHRVKGHNGVDYAAPPGTPVWAAAAGEIVFRGDKGGAGNMVILAHAGGMRTLYMHLSRFRGGQTVGQRVPAKTVIGYVGATGLATGPHLHFGVTVAGRYVDPQRLKMHRHAGVAAADRGRFSRWRKEIATRLAEVD